MFNAGAVYVLLGGKLDKGGFQQFDKSMKESAAKASAFEKSLGASSARSSAALHKMGTAAKYGAAGGILALGAAVAYSVKKAADFEQQMSSLGAVTKANGRQMQQFKKQAMDAGAATKYSALEAAQAQTELAKGGLSVSQILKGGLKGALALAAAGELDLADAASYTVNALKLFKMDGDRAVHVADALATAANDTTADVQDFGAALVQGGGAARSAGYSFDDTVTILEALAQVGVKNSDAGTSLKTALLQLIGPTKQQAAAASAAHLSFLDQNGSMKSVTDISAMLRSKTEDMTKAQRTQLFQTLAGTDGFRTLLALYDAGPAKLERLEKGLGKSGTAAEVAAKKQDNLKGKLENLGGSIETAAITAGQQLLPVLTKEAEKLTDFINAASKNGDIKKFGTDVAQGFETAFDHLPEVAHTIGDIGQAAGTAVSAVAPLVKIIGSIDPHILAGAALGFAGFKVAQFVAPGIAAVASAMSSVGMAARTAPSVGAFFGDIAAMIGPSKLLIGAAAAIGAAIVVLSGQESDEERIAKDWADAKKAQAEAAKAAADAIRASADTGLGAKQAHLDAKKAHLDAQQAEKDYKAGKISLGELRQARLGDQQASLRSHEAAATNRDAIQKETDTLESNVKASKKRRDEAQKTVDQFRNSAAAQNAANSNPRLHGVGRGATAGAEGASTGTLKALALAQKVLNQENEDYIQKLAVQGTAQQSRDRLMKASTAITEENAAGVSKLIEQLGGVDAKHQSKLLLDDQGALSKLGNFMASMRDLPKSVRTTVLTDARSATAALLAFRAIQAGIPAAKVTKILTDADSAKAQVLAFRALLAGVPARKVANIVANTSGQAEVDALRGSIAALQSKNVTITTTRRDIQIHGPQHASGRRSGMAEVAEVGEGGGPEYVVNRRTGMGYVTDGPRMAALGPDDYVVPTESRYRGRALGLLANLARDLGVQGFAKGKQPIGHKLAKRYVEGGVPFEDVQSQWENVKGNYSQAKSDAKSKDKTTKARGEAQVKRLRPKYDQLKKLVKEARKTSEHTKNLESELNVLSDGMDLADKRYQAGKYDKLKGQRVNKLLALQKVLQTALKSPARSDSRRSINEQLSQLANDLYDTRHSKPTVADVADPEAFTKAEKAQLADLNAKLAVAELTDAVEGPGEDRDLLTRILGIDNAALTRAKGAGTPPAVLQAAAEAVKATQDQLKGLTSPGTPDTSPDLQAQLDQAKEQARVAGVERDLNAAALTAGFGPRGTSGPSMVQNNYMMHPADSSVLRAVGGAAMAGVSHGGGQRSPRLNAGM